MLGGFEVALGLAQLLRGFCGCTGLGTCAGGFCGCLGSGMCAGGFGTCAGRFGGMGDVVYVLEGLVMLEGRIFALQGLWEEVVCWEELGFVPDL